jgi:hypothetical protein
VLLSSALTLARVRAEGARTATRPGVQAAATLAAKFRDSKHASICMVCKSESMRRTAFLR